MCMPVVCVRERGGEREKSLFLSACFFLSTVPVVLHINRIYSIYKKNNCDG